jgi:hypothetical protein
MSIHNIDSFISLPLEDRSVRSINTLILTVRKQLTKAKSRKQRKNSEIAYLNEKLLLLINIQETSNIF